MVRKVLHKDIDRRKYSECLKNSDNYMIYAEGWYLDIVSEGKWDCYVLGDYEAIMPVPYSKKWGVKFITHPIFCQQLGIFSKLLNDDIPSLFFQKIANKLIYGYNFNEFNHFPENLKLIQRNNYLLDLSKPYEELKVSFRRDRQKDIRRIEKLGLNVNTVLNTKNFRDDLSHKYPQLRRYFLKENFYLLLNELVKRKLFDFYSLGHQGTIASLFICHSGNRRILFFSTKDFSNEFKGAFAYLLSRYIEDHSGMPLILDFEGSMIESIADFNKSFGAEKHTFPAIDNREFFSKFTILKGKE